MTKVRYTQLGEQRGIGATMHLIEFLLFNTVVFTIITDCGVGFFRTTVGENSQYAPISFLRSQYINVIVFTHAHMDHLGAGPRIVAEHPEAVVLISSQTLDGGQVLLQDGINIQERSAKRAMQKARHEHKNPGFEKPVLYDKNDLEVFLNNPQMQVLSPDSAPWYNFTDKDNRLWWVGLSPAGHDQGAMSVFIAPPDNMWRPVYLTGDICSENNIAPGVMLPPDAFLGEFLDLPGLILITETTNGNRVFEKSRAQLKAEFAEAIRMVRTRGGTSLVHTFSRGRSSEAVLMLLEAGVSPVHVDGMARKMVMREIPDINQLIADRKVIFIEEDRLDANRHRHGLAKGDDPCGHGPAVVISPASTLEQGPAAGYAANGLLDNPNNAVVSVGHRFPDTVADQITKMERGHTIKLQYDGEDRLVNVRCDVLHFGFSGHDEQKRLVDRVELCKATDVIGHHTAMEGDEPVGFLGLQRTVIQRLGHKSPNMFWAKHNTTIEFDGNVV